MKGLTVSVYRDADGTDCSNRGVTSRFKRLTLVDPMIDEIFEATPDCPALVLVRRTIGGRPYIHAVPADLVGSGKIIMFGGNYVASSDSRVSAISPYPIPVHDRVETQEDYDRMSV